MDSVYGSEMDKKTSAYEGAGSNFYEGGADDMGRDSPGALLDMLAEVASQTLDSEKKQKQNEMTCGSRRTAVKEEPLRNKIRHQSQQPPQKTLFYTIEQLVNMPAAHLIKQFTSFSSDELKRQYSYTCTLFPNCGKKYTSFANEERARIAVKTHLMEHLENLKKNPGSCKTLPASAVASRCCKSSVSGKKARTTTQQQVAACKKPQENVNKENKEVVQLTRDGDDKCTSYLRKILANDISSKKPDGKVKQKKPRKETSSNATFLGDHSYFGKVKRECKRNDAEETSPKIFTQVDDSAEAPNMVLMVMEEEEKEVEGEEEEEEEEGQVCVEEAPSSYITLYQNPEDERQYSGAKGIEDSLEEQVKEEMVGSMESNEGVGSTSKPKGKAKFIGTSKEEREMALALMERIKKKGNPTGNNLQCRICEPPRSFTAPTTLVSHYRSHAGIKPYECRLCKAVFTRRHSLKYHMLIHQNQTRFTCPDCQKKFRHPSHFREHRRRHTGEAPFECHDCGQRFKTRNTYKRHLKTRHGKVLTTTGELLELSEEDFEKVRTNRRRVKAEYVPPPTTAANEDEMAANVIVRFEEHELDDCPVQDSGEAATESLRLQVMDDGPEDGGAVWLNYCDISNDVELGSKEVLDQTDDDDSKVNEGTLANVDLGDNDNLEGMMHSDMLYHGDSSLYNSEYMDVADYADVSSSAFVYEEERQEEPRVKVIAEKMPRCDSPAQQEPQRAGVLCKREFDCMSSKVKSMEEREKDASETPKKKDNELIVPEVIVKSEAVETEICLVAPESAAATNVPVGIKLLRNHNNGNAPQRLHILKNTPVVFGNKAQQQQMFFKLVPSSKQQNGILLLTNTGTQVAGFFKLHQNSLVLKQPEAALSITQSSPQK